MHTGHTQKLLKAAGLAVMAGWLAYIDRDGKLKVWRHSRIVTGGQHGKQKAA